MRAVFASTLEHGGPVSHMRYLLPRIADAGVDVTLLCQSEKVASDFDAIGVRTHVAPLRSRLDLRGAKALRSYLAEADVVHTQDRRAGLYARTLASAVGARIVHTIHGLPEEIAGRVGTHADGNLLGASRLRLAWIVHGYLRIESVLARLGCVVTPSQAMARYLVGHGLPRERMRVIRSGIDVRRFDPPPLHDPPRIGVAANLEPWKGIDTFLDACSVLRSRLSIEIWGDGSQRPALERRARALGLDAAFHGHVPDVRDEIADLDVFVLPSRAENLPVSLLEAMSSAIPVVATKVGGVPEIVSHGETGLLVEPNDPSALASAIRGLTADESLRIAMGAAGARAVAERFDAAVSAAQTIQLYEALCASSK